MPPAQQLAWTSAALPTVLLSIKPHYADLIERGLKLVEFRRRFPRDIGTARVLFYVTTPVQELRMVAEVTHVQRGPPAGLWRDFSKLAGLTREHFDDYFDGQAQGVALTLRAVRRLAPPTGTDLAAKTVPRLQAASIAGRIAHRFAALSSIQGVPNDTRHQPTDVTGVTIGRRLPLSASQPTPHSPRFSIAPARPGA